MTSLRLFDAPAPALAGADHVLVAGPRAALPGALRRAVRAAWARTAERLARDTAPGDLGQVVATHPASGRPRRVSVAVLPDAMSRRLSASRNLAILSCLGKADLRRAGSLGVLLVLDAEEHYLAAAAAVAKSLPLYSRKTRGAAASDVRLAAVLRDGRRLAVPERAESLLAAVRWAAEQVDRPAAELGPEDFVDRARELLRPHGRAVRVRVVVGEELRTMGLAGIHAVGRAARVPPRLLVAEFSPRAAAMHVALVGKGIVFDTGGLNLKPRDGMAGMKCDMGGAAAVVGALHALASTSTAVRLTCLAPLAENAIGPESYRPDDVLTLHSGQSVEINNTDAEGRLLLADAVSLAAREYRPDVIVDAATLTGAQAVATGRRHAAVVGSRAALEDLAVASGLASGDHAHPVLFAPELFQSEFRSQVADMTNSVRDRTHAPTSCAAQFIWSHVSDLDPAWLHVDLAGPAFVDGRGTGFGVALLDEFVRKLRPEHLRAPGGGA